MAAERRGRPPRGLPPRAGPAPAVPANSVPRPNQHPVVTASKTHLPVGVVNSAAVADEGGWAGPGRVGRPTLTGSWGRPGAEQACRLVYDVICSPRPGLGRFRFARGQSRGSPDFPRRCGGAIMLLLPELELRPLQKRRLWTPGQGRRQSKPCELTQKADLIFFS